MESDGVDGSMEYIAVEWNGMESMECNAVEWNGIDGIQCTGVEWNGCILGHFGSCCALLVIFWSNKRKIEKKKNAQQRSVSD